MSTRVECCPSCRGKKTQTYEQYDGELVKVDCPECCGSGYIICGETRRPGAVLRQPFPFLYGQQGLGGPNEEASDA